MTTEPVSREVPSWLWPLFLIPAGLFFIGLGIESQALRVAVKPIPVLALAAAVRLAAPRMRYPQLVAFGLFFGAVGDLLLELDWFELGLGSFLVGQILYIIAFVGDENRLRLSLVIPFAAWGVGLTWFLADGAGDLLIPVALYAAALCTAMWRATARIGVVARITGLTTAIGTVLFGISDSMIAIDRFGTEITGGRWFIMVFYWSAQILIAYGALRHEG